MGLLRDQGSADDVGQNRTPIRFHDPALQDQFDRDGFTAVPFLDATGLATLRSLWDEVGPEQVRGIYSNVHDRTVSVNRHVDETITRVFAEPASRLFADGYLAGASFLVKGVGVDSASLPHQDWSNVDERFSLSLSIWCPLVDVDAENGALVVIPGSHRLTSSVRSVDTDSLYLEFTPELDSRLVTVEVPAGHAVLYAHNLFHGSRPNRTDSIRVCAVSGVLARGARHIHYRRIDDDPCSFEVLEVDRQFFLTGIPDMKAGRIPDVATARERVRFDRPVLDVSDVLGLGADATDPDDGCGEPS